MPKHGLRAAEPDPEPGDHLVEHEQRAGAACTARAGARGSRGRAGRGPCWRRPARRAPRRGRRRARSNAASTPARSLNGDDDRVGHRAGGDAGRAGEPERGDAAARGDEQRVEVAVVAAGELQDLGPTGGAAREAHRGHRRLGARRDEAHLLDRRPRGRRSPRPARPRAASARRTTCRRPRPAAPRRRSRGARDRGSTRPTTARSRGSGCPRCRRGTRPRRAPTKNGSPPTAPNARTGEFTPPGIRASAAVEQLSHGSPHGRHASSARRARAAK